MTHDNQRTPAPMPSQKLASALNDFLHQSRENAQTSQATQPAEVTDEQIINIAAQWSNKEFAEGAWRFCTDFARAILALRPVRVPMTPLTDAQMEKGRDQIFSINNPYCPCDHKTFKKVAQWVERHHQIGITAQAKKEGV